MDGIGDEPAAVPALYQSGVEEFGGGTSEGGRAGKVENLGQGFCRNPARTEIQLQDGLSVLALRQFRAKRGERGQDRAEAALRAALRRKPRQCRNGKGMSVYSSKNPSLRTVLKPEFRCNGKTSEKFRTDILRMTSGATTRQCPLSRILPEVHGETRPRP